MVCAPCQYRCLKTIEHRVLGFFNRTCRLQARRVLTSIRGTADVDTELDDISQASAIAAQVWCPPFAKPSFITGVNSKLLQCLPYGMFTT